MVWFSYYIFQTKKALESAKEEFNSQNETLKADLPRLFEGKIDYFQPSFEALVRSQVIGQALRL